MIPRRLTVIVTAAALIIGAGGCATQPPTGNPSSPEPSGSTAVIGLTYIPNIQFAPFYNADAAGWYTADADLSLRHHGSSEGLFTALQTGEEQFTVAGGDEILQARSQGIDVIAVAAYYHRYPVRVIVPEDSPIKTVGDLKGHTIGLPGKFGENWFALLSGLDQAGLSESDVTIAEIGYTQQTSLSTGQVDAVVGFSNSDLIVFQAMGIPVRVLDWDVPLVGSCLATTSAFAASHPALVSLAISGMVQGMVTATDDVATTMSNAAAYIPSFRDEVYDQALKILPATTLLFSGPDGTISPKFDQAQWTTMGQTMASLGIIPDAAAATAAFTNDYIPG